MKYFSIVIPRQLVVCICFVIIIINNCFSKKQPNVTVLKQWPMLGAHDAATTYLPEGLINRWAKTQPSGGIKQLLDCGVRFFDWRPKLLSNGNLIMHHSAIDVKYPMSKVLDDLSEWLSNNTDQEAPENNFVVLGITDCDAQHPKTEQQCYDAAAQELQKHNMAFIRNCTLTHNMTVSTAMKLSKLPVLGFQSCWDENYDKHIACSGFGNSYNMKNDATITTSLSSPNRVEYTCYNDSDSKSFPLNRMYDYINKTLTNMTNPVQMFTVQCIWQETVDSIIVSGLHGSSLLLDETKSQINLLIAKKIMNNEFDVSHVNVLEINNVCDNGLVLLNALREKS